MKITKDCVVSVHYTLTNDEGQVLDSSVGGEPLMYLHGHHSMIPGFEKALENAQNGDQLSFTVEPADGYGEPVAEAIFDVPLNEFGPANEVTIGMQVQGQTQDGHIQNFNVVAVTDTHVTLDANHPLAGKSLNFTVDVVALRSATEQELAHGHVHRDGHDH